MMQQCLVHKKKWAIQELLERQTRARKRYERTLPVEAFQAKRHRTLTTAARAAGTCLNTVQTNLAGAGTPEVHARSQPNRQDVEGGPVDQVQVEVVLELRRIQHLTRACRDKGFRLSV